MSVIYPPRQRSLEYSPLAINLYNGCTSGCSYCYCASGPMQMDTGHAVPKKDLIKRLSQELAKSPANEQVMLCFMGDAYNAEEEKLGITREALELLSFYHVPTAVLTKGGTRCLRDLDIFQSFKAPLKVGASLTLFKPEDSREWEPGAATPMERLVALKSLHDLGVMTWASMEPVIDPAQTLSLITLSHEYVDQYAVGMLNHRHNTTDWTAFGNEVVWMLRAFNKRFYVKADLRRHITIPLRDVECDPATITLPTRQEYLEAANGVFVDRLPFMEEETNAL